MFYKMYEDKTKYVVEKALCDALHFVKEGKSCLLKTSNKAYLERLNDLIKTYDLSYLINDLRLTTTDVLNYPTLDLDELDKYYNSKNIKLTKNLLADYLFYELNYNEIYLDCINGNNKSHIDELYNNFTLIEQYFNKYSYNSNAFCYANFLEYDEEKIKDIITKLLNYPDNKEETASLETIKEDLEVYQSLLDYDDLIYKISFTKFKSLLEYQLYAISDLKIMQGFNEIFIYLSRIGAYNFIPYIKKEDNKTKILAALDYSLIKFNINNLDEVKGTLELKEEIRKYDEAFLSEVKALHLEKVKKMRLACNYLIDSNLNKVFTKRTVSNPYFLDLFPLQIGDVNLDFDEVIDLDGMEVALSPKIEAGYLAEVVETSFGKCGYYMHYDESDKTYHLVIEDKIYNCLLDHLITKEERFLEENVICFKDLCLDYQKEVSRFVSSLSSTYKYVPTKETSYDIIYKVFNTYNYFDEQIKYKETKDLAKYIKKIVEQEGPITKKEITRIIKEHSKKKLAKDFSLFLDNYLASSKINKYEDFYYLEMPKFRIKDYKKVSDICKEEFIDFTRDLILNSYKLDFLDYKKLLRHYLNVRISKQDEIYLAYIYEKVMKEQE